MPLSPVITKKAETVYTVNDSTKKLFQVIYREKNKPEVADDEVPKIKVSDLISKMAFYYEKLRNAVEYREEHLLRKNAILRILRRLINIGGMNQTSQSEEIAKDLLTELIRAGYLPNNKIPETKIAETAAVIDKYLKLRNFHTAKAELSGQEKKQTANWVLAMAACEIEDKLCTNLMTQVIISQMYDILVKNIRLPAGSEFARDKEIQIYLGIHRIYLKYDKEMTEHLLLKYYNAGWSEANDEEIKKVANNLEIIRQAIAEQVANPLGDRLKTVISGYTVFYTILKDVIEDDPVEVYENLRRDYNTFAEAIKRFCAKRYKAAKAKLRRAAVRSIIYIFLTKMVLAYLLEVPATLWLGETVSYLALAINITFPPFLLFLIVLFTRLPSSANTQRIIHGIDQIVFIEKEKKEPFSLREPAKRKSGINLVFGIIYAITFIVSFGAVVWFLKQINFSYVSILIFLFFLTLVSYFAIRIRRGAREMVIVERKDNLVSLLVDFFYVPIVAAGKWLNERFSRLNVFAFILDFIIEAPFKVFVEIAEEWTKYVRERKEEIM